jgi:hypothetical protein
LNFHRVSVVRWIKILTAEPLVPDRNALEIEIAIAKLKEYKLQCSDKISAELIQTGDETVCAKIHNKVINYIWNKEELPDQWKEPVIVPVRKRVIKLTVVIIIGYHCYLLQYPSLKVKSIYIYIYT